MTDVAHAHDAHAAPSAPTGWHRLTAPGWLRVLWVTPLFFGIGLALRCTCAGRLGWDPIGKGTVIATVELVTTPLGFLVGLGGFDYWAYYASGRPTRGRGPLGPRRASRGATTSASTPTTR